MECKKFDGPNKEKRIHALFRYLDPSGEGQVSESEWTVLDLLKSEINLSIKEFVQFLERTFGGDLEHAWEYLDGDGGGEIDDAEWVQGIQDIGYFGPTIP